MKVVLIAVAAAAGALSRYGVGTVLAGRSFPWATLSVNLSGSFVLGLLLPYAVARGWSETALLPMSVGFLGAYTTFSTFSYEAVTLLRDHRAPAALAYVAASVGGGLLAASLGYALADRLASP